MGCVRYVLAVRLHDVRGKGRARTRHRSSRRESADLHGDRMGRVRRVHALRSDDLRRESGGRTRMGRTVLHVERRSDRVYRFRGLHEGRIPRSDKDGKNQLCSDESVNVRDGGGGILPRIF